MDPMTHEDWTASDAIRVVGIALFRQTYKDEIGDLPPNGTAGEFAMEDASALFERCPGLRYVLEAGVRALAADDKFQAWLMTLYSGGAADCLRTEEAIAASFPPDPNAMSADEIVASMIAIHNRAASGWLPD